MMNELELLRAQLELSHKQVESYEEEAREADILELERSQIMKRLQENSAKFDQLKLKMDGYRRDIRERMAELQAEYEGKQKGGAA